MGPDKSYSENFVSTSCDGHCRGRGAMSMLRWCGGKGESWPVTRGRSWRQSRIWGVAQGMCVRENVDA